MIMTANLDAAFPEFDDTRRLPRRCRRENSAVPGISGTYLSRAELPQAARLSEAVGRLSHRRPALRIQATVEQRNTGRRYTLASTSPKFRHIDNPKHPYTG